MYVCIGVCMCATVSGHVITQFLREALRVNVLNINRAVCTGATRPWGCLKHKTSWQNSWSWLTERWGKVERGRIWQRVEGGVLPKDGSNQMKTFTMGITFNPILSIVINCSCPHIVVHIALYLYTLCCRRKMFKFLLDSERNLNLRQNRNRNHSSWENAKKEINCSQSLSERNVWYFFR